MYYNGRRIWRWYLGARRIVKMYLRGRLIWQLPALVHSIAAGAVGVLPPPSAFALASTRRLVPSVGAFWVTPDDPIWQGSVGDAGNLDRTDLRLSDLAGNPQAVRSTGAPWRPGIAQDYAEYLFLYAELGNALLEGSEPVDVPLADFDVEWRTADAPGQPALRLVRGGNPTVYEIIPDALRTIRGLRVKEETWRFRCRIGYDGLEVDLPEQGFVTLTVPGVPGLPSTEDTRVRGIGVEATLDVATALLPHALRVYERPLAEAPASADDVPADDVRAVQRRTLTAADFALLAQPEPPEEGLAQAVEPPSGTSLQVNRAGVVLEALPDRSVAYDTTLAFSRRVGVDWSTEGAEGGVQWDMDSFVHLRLLNREAQVLPAAPQNLAAAGRRKSVDLTWDLANDLSIDRYEAQYKLLAATGWTDEDVGFTSHATTGVLVDGATGFGEDAALEDGDYMFRVRAVNSVGEGPWAEVQGSPEATTRHIPRIEGLRVRFDAAKNEAILNWRPIAWAGVDLNGDGAPDGYIDVRTRNSADDIETPGGNWGRWGRIPDLRNFVDLLALTEYVVEGLSPRTYYGFQLRLGVGHLLGPESDEVGGHYLPADELDRKVTVDSPEVEEPPLPTDRAPLAFTLTLDPEADEAVVLRYRDSGTGTATAGQDYEAFKEGTVTFTPGETEKTITVQVIGGTSQRNETVALLLSDLEGAAFDGDKETLAATGIILGSAVEAFSIDSPSVVEPAEGSVDMDFTIRLGVALGFQTSVHIVDTGHGTAVSGQDYDAFAERTLMFAPRETVKTVTVRVRSDSEASEQDETVVLRLESPSGTLSIRNSEGTGTILAAPELDLTFDATDVLKPGDGETVRMAFTAKVSTSRDLLPGEVVRADIDYADAGTGTATSGEDYSAVQGGTLAFTQDALEQVIDVVVQGGMAAANETITLRLDNVRTEGMTYAGGAVEATGTIFASASYSLSIEGGTVREPEPGSVETVPLVFTVRLETTPADLPLDVPLSVQVRDTGDGTATSGADYEAFPSQRVSFQGMEREKQVTVQAKADKAMGEPPETVVLELLAPGIAGVTIPKPRATGTILDACDGKQLAWLLPGPPRDFGISAVIGQFDQVAVPLIVEGLGEVRLQLPPIDPDSVCSIGQTRYRIRITAPADNTVVRGAGVDYVTPSERDGMLGSGAATVLAGTWTTSFFQVGDTPPGPGMYRFTVRTQAFDEVTGSVTPTITQTLNVAIR